MLNNNQNRILKCLRHRRVIVILIVFLLSMLSCVYLTCLNISKSYMYSKYSRLLKEKNIYSIVSSVESYNEDLKYENINGIQFPHERAEYGYIYYLRSIKIRNKLSGSMLDEVLNVLNDSSSYVWGEIGTPEFDVVIVFHNKNDKVIGVTEIDFDGQSYSYPSLARMKWGSMKNMRTLKDAFK